MKNVLLQSFSHKLKLKIKIKKNFERFMIMIVTISWWFGNPRNKPERNKHMNNANSY